MFSESFFIAGSILPKISDMKIMHMSKTQKNAHRLGMRSCTVNEA